MKHTRIKALAAAMLLLTTMTGCGAGSGISLGHSAKAVELTAGMRSTGSESTKPDEAFLQGQTAFALSLMQEAAKTREGRNVLLSPYSLMQALAMTANGAAGDTRAEMEQVLGGLPLDTLNSGLNYERQNARKTVMKTANSIWYRDEEDFSVKNDFLKNAVGYYDAEIYKAPFDGTTLNDINSWCNDKTDGMIPEILREISGETVMYLFNAVSFDAKWKEPFEEPDTGVFTTAGGQQQNVMMMNSTESVFIGDEHADGFLKPYKNGYSFAAILPEQGLTPEAYLAMQTPESLRGLLTGSADAEVYIEMPQFRVTDGMELNDTLKAMGMEKAFGAADFSEMTDIAVNISTVYQKTFIDVNAKGTKAAAVTEVAVDSCAPEQPPHSVILDRPFLYMIVDDETMLPVFTGILNAVND